MPSRALPRVKIYGERNTGTNYLSELLELNFELEEIPGKLPSGWARRSANWLARMSRKRLPLPLSQWVAEWPKDVYFAQRMSQTLGWKHCFPPADRLHQPGVVDRILLITRNPYAWLLSMRRRPYHAERHQFESLLEFLDTPWPTVRRELVPQGLPRVFPSPVALYNEKGRAFATLTEQAPATLIRYEDVIIDPPAFLERLASDLGWSLKGSQPVNVLESTKRDAGKGFDYYRDYYLHERWRGSLTAGDVERINRELDPEVCAKLGYTVIAPDSVGG